MLMYVHQIQAAFSNLQLRYAFARRFAIDLSFELQGGVCMESNFMKTLYTHRKKLTTARNTLTQAKAICSGERAM